MSTQKKPSKSRSSGSNRTSTVVAQDAESSTAGLSSALMRLTKTKLVEVLLDIGDRWPEVLEHLRIEYDPHLSTEELQADIESSLRRATFVPKHLINHNFDYDLEAYERVAKGLSKLVAAGDLAIAMKLALQAMRLGSEQVALSDEGMMSDEVLDCVRVVYSALQAPGIDIQKRDRWLAELNEADSTGFLAAKVPKLGSYFWR